MSSTEREDSLESRSARNQRNAARLRLDRAAAQGTHLPSMKDLILGCVYLGKDIRVDAAAFAERIMGRIDTNTDAGRQAHAALATLTAGPDLAVFESAAAAIRGAVEVAGSMSDFGIDVAAILDRLDFYSANLGSEPACIRIAQCALDLANGDDMCVDEISLLTEAAVGWLASAQSASPILLRGREKMSRWSEHRLAAERNGDRLIKAVLRHHELLGGDIVAAQGDVADVLADAKDPKASGQTARRSEIPAAARVLDVDLDRHEIEDLVAVPPPPGLVVISEIGSPSTRTLP